MQINMHFSADLIPDSAPSKICRHFPIPSKVHRRPRAGRILSVTGPRAGDQTGREVASSAYDPDRWEECWRYCGDEDVDGIAGHDTVVAMQRFLNSQLNAGLELDGILGSLTCKAFQRWLNKQK